MSRQFDQLSWMAAHVGDETAYADLDGAESLTFEQWERDSNRLAHGLTAAGVEPRDRVALYLESAHTSRWLTSYVAIHKAGAVVVPTNTRLTAREVRTILSHAEPVVAISSTALATTIDEIRDALPTLRMVIRVDTDEWQRALDNDASPCDPPVGDDDLADIMYTSGTTGLPKGIAVRHRNTHIIENGEPAWTGESWLHGAPLFTFAGVAFIFNPMKMGMRALYIARFDVDRWIDAVETHRPTCAFLVPSMVQLLLNAERFTSADLSSLTLVSIGSAPLAPSQHQAMAARLPGAMVTNNYSMTEAGTTFTFMPPDEITRRPGSVGIPMGGEVRIADDEGEPLPAGEIGEILLRVGTHHREYYRDPDATERTWSGEWLHSGDLGSVDADGYLYIKGRKKDVIIRGGNNVLAGDVEAVLVEHPAVLEAAVIAVPHDVLGEDVGAFVVARLGSTIDVAALTAFCAERIADYKVPRRIWVIDELPRNATGKVVKSQLRIPEEA